MAQLYSIDLEATHAPGCWALGKVTIKINTIMLVLDVILFIFLTEFGEGTRAAWLHLLPSAFQK